jgi:thiamine kinase-like enzyme
MTTEEPRVKRGGSTRNVVTLKTKDDDNNDQLNNNHNELHNSDGPSSSSKKKHRRSDSPKKNREKVKRPESGEVAPKDIKKSNDRTENGINNNNNSDDEKPSPHPDGSSGADRGSGSNNNDQPGTLDTPTNNTNTTQHNTIAAAAAAGPSTTSPKPLRLSEKFKALFKRDKKKEKPRNSRSSQNINNLNLNNASNGGAHNNGKDDKKEDPRSAREKKVTRANCFAELSEELQKKIKKAKLHEDEVNKQFWVLLNVLHFITKESYRMEGQDSPPVQRRRPYAPVKSIEAAKQLAQAPDKDTKKLFKNLEFSGKGGFGRVFGGKDIATRHRVAIKKLPHVTDKDKRNNYSEIAFLMTCEHPNIVKFLSAYEVKEEVWIVMEFLEGGTLNEAVKVHQFSEKHIAYVAREMLKGLKYLHAQGFVHRDLKSANVMMSIDGDIKLIDFGLCADVSEGERVQMLGSPFWMPPEMIHRKPHGCAADIWSFAVCILEMYLKEPPNSSSRLRAMYYIGTEGCKHHIPSRASEQARDFLGRCLEMDPSKRATAVELLEHPFVTQPRLHEGIKDVLRGVFVSNSLALSGI